MKSSEEQKLTNDLVSTLSENFFRSGHLDESDLKDRITLGEKLKSLLGQVELAIIIDHRGSLLEEAERFVAEGQSEMALMLYAMFIEHSINGVIVSEVEKKRKFSNQVVKSVIRQVNLEGKLTWLAELLGFPRFNDSHLKWIKKISEERNAFVHYKWQPTADDWKDSRREKERIHELAEHAKKAARYMKSYEARCLFNGKKGKLKNALKRSQQHVASGVSPAA